MKKKIVGSKVILWSFIIIICCSWLIWSIFGICFDTKNHENRQLAEIPQFSFNNYLTFPNDFENYFNDNLPFRNQLISLNSCIDFFIFDKSTNHNVIKGENGWLFYSETIGDYQGLNPYSTDELEIIKEDVLSTKDYFESQGIEFAIFIGPNKNTVYGEYMPQYIEKYSNQSRVQQMVDYLRDTTDVNIIFPKEELITARAEHPELQYYLKLDTHWNYMGGYFGSLPLLNSINASSVEFDKINYMEVNEPVFIWNGYDEANMLGLSSELNEDTNYRISGGLLDSVRYDGNTRLNINDFDGAIRAYSDSCDLRKVFLARDSFGEAISPYLAAAFSEMYSVNSSSLTRRQIASETPNVFIYESVERGDFIGCFNYLNWPQ